MMIAVAQFVWNRFTNDFTATPKYQKHQGPSVPSESAEIDESDTHPLDPLLALARQALEVHQREHRDYTASLIKHERIGDKLQPESKMDLKLLYRSTSGNDAERKVSVYLKSVEPKAQAGREVIWNQDENENKLRVHEAGVLGLVTVDLAPASMLAMAGNRYAITEIGIEKLLTKLIERGESDRKLGPATVRTTENVVIDSVNCKLLEVIHEHPTELHGGKEVRFEFYLVQIYMDESRMVPIKYSCFSWPKMVSGKIGQPAQPGQPELLEEYTYSNLKLNVGLTEQDFDSKNTAYRF